MILYHFNQFGLGCDAWHGGRNYNHGHGSCDMGHIKISSMAEFGLSAGQEVGSATSTGSVTKKSFFFQLGISSKINCNHGKIPPHNGTRNRDKPPSACTSVATQWQYLDDKLSCLVFTTMRTNERSVYTHWKISVTTYPQCRNTLYNRLSFWRHNDSSDSEID